MVPRDLPIAAHDMALRFMHVDTLNSAGPSAIVPSRLGNEVLAILGSVQANGETLDAAVEAVEAKTIPITTEEMERNHERQFGFRQSILLFCTVFFVGFSVWGFFRIRRNSRQYGKVKKSRNRRKGIRLDESNVVLVEAARRAEEKKLNAMESVFDLGEEELEESSDDGDIGTSRR